MSVLCRCTLNVRRRSFWVSKSISKSVTSLNFALPARFDSIGFCTLQIGHQTAETSTKIGFPAPWAAAKVLASNGFRSIALTGQPEIETANSERADNR